MHKIPPGELQACSVVVKEEDETEIVSCQLSVARSRKTKVNPISDVPHQKHAGSGDQGSDSVVPSGRSLRCASISSHYERIRVNTSAYDHFFNFMKSTHRAGKPGIARMLRHTNGLREEAHSQLCKEASDLAPMNPTKSDHIRLRVLIFMFSKTNFRRSSECAFAKTSFLFIGLFAAF
jgi:hypothetical protein